MKYKIRNRNKSIKSFFFFIQLQKRNLKIYKFHLKYILIVIINILFINRKIKSKSINCTSERIIDFYIKISKDKKQFKGNKIKASIK